jgi:hypothetical protein
LLSYGLSFKKIELLMHGLVVKTIKNKTVGRVRAALGYEQL